MSYEDSYARKFPFYKMVDDAIQDHYGGNKAPRPKGGACRHGPVKRRRKLIPIVNNRSGGNGPVIAQEITERLRELIF